MTRRLFDENPQQLQFSAKVLSCVEGKKGYEVVLEETCFFPEGGGQGADMGTLGNAHVLDAHEKDGVITHYTDAPLSVGEVVTGQVDALRRLAMSQQHSGEHILTGLVHQKYGYDNVGFHIGTEAVTVDFSGPLTEEQVREMELAANQVIWQNLPIRAWFPTAEELETLEYRSKKAIEGALRMVSIPGVDTCACCGTHMPTTGGVGQIKAMSVMNYKGGVRLSILCGIRALMAENQLMDENRAVSQALSAKPGTLVEAVQRLQQERDALKAKCDTLGTALFEQRLKEEQSKTVRIVDGDYMNPSLQRKAAARLAEGGRLGLLLVPKGEGWSFVLSSGVEDVRPVGKVLTEHFGGRCGGPKDMVQGMLERGTVEEIRGVLENLPASP